MINKENIEEIENEEDLKTKALAEYLKCEKDDLTELIYTCYGLKVYSFHKEEYAIGTDEEANKAVSECIKSMVWNFDTDFIIKHTKLCYMYSTIFDLVENFKMRKSERANPYLLSLIEDMDKFIGDAISLYGRNHFLPSYDEKEIKQNGFFIYRV